MATGAPLWSLWTESPSFPVGGSLVSRCSDQPLGGGRRWRLLALAVLVAALAVIVVGCGGDDEEDEAAGPGDTAAATDGGNADGSIWVLLPDSATSDRWEKDDRRFFAEAVEAAGLSGGDDFPIVNAEGDANTQ